MPNELTSLEITNNQIMELEFALTVIEQNCKNFRDEKDTYKEFYLQKLRAERNLEILNQIKKDLEELEHWRNDEMIMVCGRHSGKTPKWVLATQEILKYKKVFEILKDKEIIKLGKNDFNHKYYLQRNDTNGNVITIEITKEEYELLEEVE